MKITTNLQDLLQSLQETVQEEIPGLSEPEQDALICSMAHDLLSGGRVRSEISLSDVFVLSPELALAN